MKRHHPHGAECPGCWAEYQRNAQKHVDSWTRVDSVRSYFVLSGAVIAAVALALVVFQGGGL